MLAEDEDEDKDEESSMAGTSRSGMLDISFVKRSMLSLSDLARALAFLLVSLMLLYAVDTADKCDVPDLEGMMRFCGFAFLVMEVVSDWLDCILYA